MPDVPSTAVRIAMPADLVAVVESRSASLGIPRDELVELAVRSRFEPDSPAVAVWDRYAAGSSQTPTAVAEALASAGILERVRGFRLGAPTPERTDPPPWSRPGTGAALSNTPAQTWPIVRGLWRMDPTDVSVIVALRLGMVLGVYRVGRWVTDELTGRRYAVDGQIITSGGRLQDAENGTDLGAASDADRSLYRILTAAPILPPAARQPVVKLSLR